MAGKCIKLFLEDESELLVSPKHKVYINEKNKNATSVALMVMQIFADYNNHNDNRYLNLSNNNDEVEEAPVASMVMRQTENLGLRGLPGSIPGWSASTLSKKNFSLQQITEVYNSVNNGAEIYF